MMIFSCLTPRNLLLEAVMHAVPLQDLYVYMHNIFIKFMCAYKTYIILPVVPHKAVAEVSKIGNL